MSTDVPSWTVEATSLFDSEIEACPNPVEVVRKADYDALNKTKSKRYVLIQDDDSHWYLIEESRRSQFLSLLSDQLQNSENDAFYDLFEKNRIGTSPSFISFENPVDIQSGKVLS